MANGSSLEALIRYDHWIPNDSSAIATSASPNPGTIVFSDQKQNRTIFGVAYWFPHQGNVTSAILVDYDGQHFDNLTTPLPIKTIAVHGLLNF